MKKIHFNPLTHPYENLYKHYRSDPLRQALIHQGLFLGSSRDLGEVEVDRQGAGKLAVSKHTTTITLLSPCIILILPPSGQVIPVIPHLILLFSVLDGDRPF
ncbi:hypothetical protein [Aeromonas caviae]